jgi:hypothetical protein
MPKPSEHNYMKKLRQLIQQGQLPEVGLERVDIYHDDWCAIHSGRYCNCDPHIDLRPLSLDNPERN